MRESETSLSPARLQEDQQKWPRERKLRRRGSLSMDTLTGNANGHQAADSSIGYSRVAVSMLPSFSIYLTHSHMGIPAHKSECALALVDGLLSGFGLPCGCCFLFLQDAPVPDLAFYGSQRPRLISLLFAGFLNTETHRCFAIKEDCTFHLSQRVSLPLDVANRTCPISSFGIPASSDISM